MLSKLQRPTPAPQVLARLDVLGHITGFVSSVTRAVAAEIVPSRAVTLSPRSDRGWRDQRYRHTGSADRRSAASASGLRHRLEPGVRAAAHVGHGFRSRRTIQARHNAAPTNSADAGSGTEDRMPPITSPLGEIGRAHV